LKSIAKRGFLVFKKSKKNTIMAKCKEKIIESQSFLKQNITALQNYLRL